MTPGPLEIARRGADGRVIVRDDPLRVRIELSGLSTSDRHDLRCALACSVRVAQSIADRQLLEEVLLGGRESVRREDVAAYLSRRVRDSAAHYVLANPADGFTAPGATRDGLLEALRKAVDAAAFACGLVVLPPWQIEAESPSLQRLRLEQAQRARAEERAAGQVEHLRRAGDLLKQFQAIRETASGLSPGHVLQRISAADQGSTLEALLLASSGTGVRDALWAVSGPYLVAIQTDGDVPNARLIPLTPSLGPLRSVQAGVLDGRRVLLVGAGTGVMVVNTEDPQDARLYRFEGQSQHGFNRVVLDESTQTMWGTHSEFGVVRWELAAPEVTGAAIQVRSGGSPRNPVAIAPETVAFSVGGQVSVVRGARVDDLPLESSGEVVAMIPSGSHCFVVRADGLVQTVDRATCSIVDSQRRGGGIIAAAALPWMSSVRLLLSREDGAIECVGPDDPLVTQYNSPHRGSRIIAASNDLIAAVSADRHRLVLWRPWDGRRPLAEVHVLSQTRHRVADVEFA
jgi:hypothetical protein